MKKKRNIRHPEKWLGKYIRHMANHMDYQFNYYDGYVICEWTGRLMTVEQADEAENGRGMSADELTDTPYDPCYCYSEEAITDFERMVEMKTNTTSE